MIGIYYFTREKKKLIKTKKVLIETENCWNYKISQGYQQKVDLMEK